MTNLEITNAYIGNTQVEKIYLGTDIVWGGGEPGPDYSKMPLTFNIISGGTIVWKTNSNAYTTTIEYSLDSGETWTIITSNIGDSAPSISVNAGDVVQFRGDNATYSTSTSYYNYFSGSTTKFEIEGNIMSLIDSTGFTTATTLASSNTFYYLFLNCAGLISAENLVLPATTLAQGCYLQMFYNCTSLTTAPSILPATTLANYCYSNMFYGCTSLTTAPSLPATTLANNCYWQMFSNCSSLTTAPVLPATTLAQDCYSYMFAGCTSLNYIKCLATADISTNRYTVFWVSGVASAGTFEGVPSTEWTIGNNGIPEGWVTNVVFLEVSARKISLLNPGDTASLDVSSTLPWSATSIPSWVSLSQTEGNSGLTTITITADTIPSTEVEDTLTITDTYKTASITITNEQNDYSKMPLTFNIISGGTINWYAQNSAFTKTIEYSKDNGSTWTSITSNTGSSAPSISVSAGDVVQFRGDNATYGNNSTKYNSFSGSTAIFEAEGNMMSLVDSTNFATATTLASSHTFYYLFRTCTGLTSAENLVLPATTLTINCYQYMFNGCKSLTTPPELPAATLTTSCYAHMFSGCTGLTKAPELPATTLAQSCYSNMFNGCTSLTTAPSILPATTMVTYCYSSMFRTCSSLTTAPELPATALLGSCYQNMFQGCTNLNYVKCLATNVTGTTYTNNWLSSVAASGTFVKHPDATWSSGASGIPDGWTIEDAI